jgi:NAD(P)-dependent dehydrogenase (short-subunit alcohol dehydrogenase family)
MKRKTALVTGGSRGIGRGIAAALAGRGWTVAINFRTNLQAAEESLEQVKKAGGDGFCIQADIGNLDEHERLIQGVLERTERIDLLVNNAGVGPRKRTDMLDLAPEQYDQVMKTNLRGPFFLTQKIASIMIDLIEQKRIDSPKIINISSISAETPSVNRGEYCISKAGISMMTKLLAVRLSEYGINVYEIRPGITKTDMTAKVQEKYDRLIAEGLTLIPRWGLPEDIGKIAAAIADDLLPYSTGESINVDGGFHVSRL